MTKLLKGFSLLMAVSMLLSLCAVSVFAASFGGDDGRKSIKSGEKIQSTLGEGAGGYASSVDYYIIKTNAKGKLTISLDSDEINGISVFVFGDNGPIKPTQTKATNGTINDDKNGNISIKRASSVKKVSGSIIYEVSKGSYSISISGGNPGKYTMKVTDSSATKPDSDTQKATTAKKVTVTAEKTAIREKASESSKQLVSAKKGQNFTTVGSTSSFWKVEFKKKNDSKTYIGYISKKDAKEAAAKQKN